MLPKISPERQSLANDVALLLLRGTLGVVFVYHGTQKLLGWFGGKGLAGAAEGFAGMGLPLPYLSAVAASVTETLGGLLLITGLFTRVSAGLLAFTMVVAVISLIRIDKPYEYPLVLLFVLVALALLGAGKLAAGRVLFKGRLPA